MGVKRWHGWFKNMAAPLSGMLSESEMSPGESSTPETRVMKWWSSSLRRLRISRFQRHHRNAAAAGFEGGLDQRLLGAEVPEQGYLGDPRLLGYSAGGGAPETGLGVNAGGCV